MTMTAPAFPPRPGVTPPAPWQCPRPARSGHGGGVTVLAYDMPGQHVAAIACHLAVPSSLEPAGSEGAAAVMAAAMLTGARGAEPRELERRAAAAGITWTTAAGHAGPTVTMTLADGSVGAGRRVPGKSASCACNG